MKGFLIGVLLGAVLFAGGIYYYFVSGMAPAAVADPPMMMERKMANRSLDAHIDTATSVSAGGGGVNVSASDSAHLTADAGDVERAVDQLDFVEPHRAWHGQRVFNGRGIVV